MIGLYALERLTNQIWTRYALCGKRPLLERVRAGLGQPEEWRIVYVPNLCAIQPTDRKTA